MMTRSESLALARAIAAADPKFCPAPMQRQSVHVVLTTVGTFVSREQFALYNQRYPVR